MRLIFGNSYGQLRSDLLADARESCAILRAHAAALNSEPRLLVRHVHLVPDDAYAYRTAAGAQLKPGYIASIVKLARAEQQSLVFVHTHPRAVATPTFSEIDDDGERVLGGFVESRIPNVPHLGLVISPTGCSARQLGRSRSVARIQDVGPTLTTIAGDIQAVAIEALIHDRQIRAIGALGQQKLAGMRVAIIGGGGTGSLTAQGLAHLGVADFLFVDGDALDRTSLNRLVGGRTQYVGMAKVRVARRLIRRISRNARIEIIDDDVTFERVAHRLLGVDAIFCCTDTHASRAVLNQIAYQFMIPVFDMGVVIAAPDGVVKHVVGRAQMLAPGLGCLQCSGVLDPDAIRRELMSEEQRRADPYIVGGHVRQPAVISLNETVVGLAMTMFLSAVTGFPSKPRALTYDAMTGAVKACRIQPDPQCVVCSPAGAYGRGDTWALPTRPHAGPSRNIAERVMRVTGQFWRRK